MSVSCLYVIAFSAISLRYTRILLRVSCLMLLEVYLVFVNTCSSTLRYDTIAGCMTWGGRSEMSVYNRR